MRWSLACLMGILALQPSASVSAEKPAVRTPREALQPFNDLIGSWRGLGTPEGKLQEKQKGLWEETIRWEWKFKDNDAWLVASFEKGKHFVEGTLRYLPEQDRFQLVLTSVDKQTVTFTGSRKDHRLILERSEEKTSDTHRLVLSVVDNNRFVYHYEIQPANRSLSRKVYQVGATKEGAPLVQTTGEIGPLCVVSFGPAVTPISYKGKTYYVCCAGCRDEFRREPDRYIKEYEEHIAQLVKERAEKVKRP